MSINKLTEYQIEYLIKKIKYMCYNVYITTDNEVYSLHLNKLKERLKDGSYGYTVNGVFKSTTFIMKHCVNISKNICY